MVNFTARTLSDGSNGAVVTFLDYCIVLLWHTIWLPIIYPSCILVVALGMLRPLYKLLLTLLLLLYSYVCNTLGENRKGYNSWNVGIKTLMQKHVIESR